MEKTLHLVLKKKWFDMIASGEKKEEYREITPYWCNRLLFGCPLGEIYWEGVVDKKNERGRDWLLAYLEINHIGYRHYDFVTFHLGYAKDRPQMTFKFHGIEARKGKEEWGAELGKEYFVIQFEKV